MVLDYMILNYTVLKSLLNNTLSTNDNPYSLCLLII